MADVLLANCNYDDNQPRDAEGKGTSSEDCSNSSNSISSNSGCKNGERIAFGRDFLLSYSHIKKPDLRMSAVFAPFIVVQNDLNQFNSPSKFNGKNVPSPNRMKKKPQTKPISSSVGAPLLTSDEDAPVNSGVGLAISLDPTTPTKKPSGQSQYQFYPLYHSAVQGPVNGGLQLPPLISASQGPQTPPASPLSHSSPRQSKGMAPLSPGGQVLGLGLGLGMGQAQGQVPGQPPLTPSSKKLYLPKSPRQEDDLSDKKFSNSTPNLSPSKPFAPLVPFSLSQPGQSTLSSSSATVPSPRQKVAYPPPASPRNQSTNGTNYHPHFNRYPIAQPSSPPKNSIIYPHSNPPRSPTIPSSPLVSSLSSSSSKSSSPASSAIVPELKPIPIPRTPVPASPAGQHFRLRPKSPLDAFRLQQRQKQIDFGYKTAGYLRYRLLVPKEKRRPEHPRTPKKTQNCSKRSWDGQLKKWRRDLHLWDPENFDNFKAFLASDLVANFIANNPDLAEIIQAVREKLENPSSNALDEDPDNDNDNNDDSDEDYDDVHKDLETLNINPDSHDPLSIPLSIPSTSASTDHPNKVARTLVF